MSRPRSSPSVAGSRVVLAPGPSMVAEVETALSLDTTFWCRYLLLLPPGVLPSSGVPLVVLELSLPPGVPLMVLVLALPPGVPSPPGVPLVVLVLPLHPVAPPPPGVSLVLLTLCPLFRPPLLPLPYSLGLRQEGLYEAPRHPEVDADRFLTGLHPATLLATIQKDRMCFSSYVVYELNNDNPTIVDYLLAEL
ncbi:hypothetical protein NDU88_008300 [Pleurodeles waltl]|uniref:Uncharacterized protein n=1 Tax=Pleurodeles waltl TaxID=8319 RepID=A0AAV7QN45_PLEWA|nr:hypothetical protein NDU88_008300 [Pleurodeles waltl]